MTYLLFFAAIFAHTFDSKGLFHYYYLFNLSLQAAIFPTTLKIVLCVYPITDLCRFCRIFLKMSCM